MQDESDDAGGGRVYYRVSAVRRSITFPALAAIAFSSWYLRLRSSRRLTSSDAAGSGTDFRKLEATVFESSLLSARDLRKAAVDELARSGGWAPRIFFELSRRPIELGRRRGGEINLCEDGRLRRGRRGPAARAAEATEAHVLRSALPSFAAMREEAGRATWAWESQGGAP